MSMDKPMTDAALDDMRGRLDMAERADLPADLLRSLIARLDAAERVVEACYAEIAMSRTQGRGINLRSPIFDAVQSFDRATKPTKDNESEAGDA